MEAAEQAFQRNLQHAESYDMEPYATVWRRGKCADQLNGKRNDLGDGAVQLDLVAVGLDRYVLEGRVRQRTGVQVVADVPDVGVNDSFLDLKDEGVRVIEGRILLRMGAFHQPANPKDVDTEVGAFAQQYIC